MDNQSRSTVKTINAMKARKYFGEMLEQVYYREEKFIIERAGKPMAAVIPLSQLDELQKHAGAAKTENDTIKERKRYTKKRRA